jgi:hypothetical protein
MTQSDPDYAARIEARAEQLDSMLDEQDIDPAQRDILIGSDMNGPLASTTSADLPLHDGVKDAFHRLDLDQDGREAAIISGYDLHTLWNFRDGRLEMPELGVVGELGSVYEIDGEVRLTAPDESDSPLIDAYRSLYQEAAVEGRKLLLQGNSSNVVGCVKVEAEGTPDDPRAEIYQRFDVDTGVDTASIYQGLEESSAFTYNEGEGMIIFDDTPAAARQVKDILTNGHAYTGVRFEDLDDDRIGFYRDREDRDIDLETAHIFIEQALDGNDITYDHNPDWGSDFLNADADVSKERGANRLAQAYFDTDDPDEYIILHVGDKQSDVMTGENTVFFAQEGMEAERYCRENDLPHITVQDGAEYADIVNHYLEEIA